LVKGCCGTPLVLSVLAIASGFPLTNLAGPNPSAEDPEFKLVFVLSPSLPRGHSPLEGRSWAGKGCSAVVFPSDGGEYPDYAREP
jgi:hypothetical protein